MHASFTYMYIDNDSTPLSLLSAHSHPVHSDKAAAVVFRLSLYVAACSAASFSYDNQGAWSGSCNSGLHQSPILINTATVVPDNRLSLALVNWNLPLDGIFKDSGITVVFSANPDAKTPTPTVVKNGVTYYVCQFHFHWGTSDTDGTEHQIDNAKYAAELHIVSVNNASYCATPGSLTTPDSVLVIGVLCKAADTPAANIPVWKKLTVPVAYSANLSVAGAKYSDMLPSSLDYYYYNGSLTAPGCSETVQWYVLKDTIDIPRDFLAQMRTIQTVDGINVTLPYNVRNLQNLNGRTVYSCQGVGCVTSPGVSEKVSASITTLWFVAGFVYMWLI